MPSSADTESFGASTPHGAVADVDLVTASEAADLLGVKTATVYTYVTRGHLTPHRRPGDRSSWFDRDELDAVLKRTGRRSSAAGAGPKETVTAISMIANGTYWYRGLDPRHLSENHSYEAVAELLWSGSLPDAPDWTIAQLLDSQPHRRGLDLTEVGRPLDAIRLAVSLLAVNDDLRFGIGGDAVIVSARRLLVGMVGMLPERVDRKAWSQAAATESFAALVWSRLAQTPPTPDQLSALNATLVVMADHGVAPSTLAVRTAASYRADLYGAVQSGLAIVAGGWHGRRALSAEAMIEAFLAGRDVATVVGEQARQGRVPALGQPRYPDGDPRVRIVLDHLGAAGADPRILEAMRELIDLTETRALPAPSVEFALAALARGFSFQRGASEALFAIGRSAGWLAHAMEESDEPDRASPQFRYVGPSPLGRS